VTLIRLPAAPWPPMGHGLHLDQASELAQRIITRAAYDAHVREEPFGSNRSAYLDALCDRFKIPRASFWCGVVAGAWWIDNDCQVPKDFPDCDRWLPYLVPAASIPRKLRVGAAILYGVRGVGGVDPDYTLMKARGWNAWHIGLVADWTTDPPITVEGNRGYAGNPNTNNGVAVDMAPSFRADILGIVLPHAA
jgi:hypothetical protein